MTDPQQPFYPAPEQPQPAYQQPNEYQQPIGYQQSAGFPQPIGYQQSAGLPVPVEYPQSAGFPVEYQPTLSYQQPTYQQPMGYQQAMGYPAMQPGYPAPGYGYPVAQSSSGLCVAGMVLGILAVLGCWVPFGGFVVGLLGLILSIAGMRQARSQGRSGFGMGVTGLVCSLVSLIPAVLVLVAFFSVAASCAAFC